MKELLHTPSHLLNRQYLDSDFRVNTWDDIDGLFKELLEREIPDEAALRQWIMDRSELDSAIAEEQAIRYINKSRFTGNEEIQQRLSDFFTGINPRLSSVNDALNRKLCDSPFVGAFENTTLKNYIRSVKSDVALFREENIPVYSELEVAEQTFGTISGAMTIRWEDNEITLQQASTHLKSTDRHTRQEVFELIAKRRSQDTKELESNFEQLLDLRHQLASNAGYRNYRDYAFVAKQRFDYTAEDCLQLHESIEKFIVPLVEEMDHIRKDQLKVDNLRPWDMEVDVNGLPPIRAFGNGDDLIRGTIQCFKEIDPLFSETLEIMEKRGLLDLDSRKEKSPGGYNYPLIETGLPFIFMNAVGTMRDVVVMTHEGGHAVHSVLCNNLQPLFLRIVPHEVAELASMSMELFASAYWQKGFGLSDDDYRRAMHEHLEHIIRLLPWIATIDAFQHWLYTHPDHTREERKIAWLETRSRFQSKVVDWSGYENDHETIWQKQGHLFYAPFYYIEYAMAQLGALSLWKDYLKDPKSTIEKYKTALASGYIKSIPETYQLAGIPFDFGATALRSLMGFVQEQLKNLAPMEPSTPPSMP
ncbi:MAG: M3 family oligoendopeptidase [Flavobacteriales bacterium]|nr:M3 family oligoendopeptidase [Flavobacteriales bacterium]